MPAGDYLALADEAARYSPYEQRSLQLQGLLTMIVANYLRGEKTPPYTLESLLPELYAKQAEVSRKRQEEIASNEKEIYANLAKSLARNG